MGPNLFWKFKILKKALLRPAGPGIRNSPGPEKCWTTWGLKCSGWQLTSKCLDLGMPGNPNPDTPKSGKKVQFQNSLQKLKNALVFEHHHKYPYWFYRIQRKKAFFSAVFWVFRIFPLWAPTYSGNLRSWKRPFWGQRVLAFEIRRGPKNAARHAAQCLNFCRSWIQILTSARLEP